MGHGPCSFTKVLEVYDPFKCSSLPKNTYIRFILMGHAISI
jgi:hypothetical protein